jgi:radical SAM superfamily enzyme YgiQ (UPF0313 family)
MRHGMFRGIKAGMDTMRVALLGFESEENLSLRYLAAAVEGAGFAVELFALGHGEAAEAVAERVVAGGPGLVGISVPFQSRAPELLALAARLRAAGYTGHLVVGGHFATFEYGAILEGHPAIDSVARHEGEDTLVELCRRVSAGGPLEPIPGLVVRRAPAPSGAGRLPILPSGRPGWVAGPKRPLTHLDALRFPDRRGAPQDVLGVAAAPMVGSRGCYADCSFCCIYAYADNAQGPRYRMRTPENIVEEMEAEYRQRGVRLFIFHDDNFFLPHTPTNLKRYRRFGELLARRGLSDIGLVIKCRPNDVDPELFQLLKDLGMIRAYVGIETNSEEGVVSLNRRISPDDNRRALRILDELEVYHSFNVLIFDPEATLEGVASNLDFMEAFADTPFNFCRAEVYAGTPLKQMLEAEGRLRGDYLAWTYEMRDPRVELLFRIVTTAFMARNFNGDGAANLNMGMRFDVEVFRRFYPLAWDRAFQRAMVDASRGLGLDSVGQLRRALEFVRRVDLRDRDRVQGFTLELARAISRTDLEFVRTAKRFRREMELRAAARPSRGYAAGQPVWAAESARLGSSTGLEMSTELLPRPAGL